MVADGWEGVLLAMTAFEPEGRATAFEVTQLLGVLAGPGVDLVAAGGEPLLTTQAASAPALMSERGARASTPRPNHASALVGIQAEG